MNKEIKKPIIIAIILCLVFYTIEIPMVLLNVFPKQEVMFIADIVIRFIIGIIALILLRRCYIQSGDGDGFEQIFVCVMKKYKTRIGRIRGVAKPCND